MQAISDDHLAIIASRFQVGEQKYGCRVEIGYRVEGSTEIGGTVDLNNLYGTITNDPGNTSDWLNALTNVNDGNTSTTVYVPWTSGTYAHRLIADLGAACVVDHMWINYTDGGSGIPQNPDWSNDGSSWTSWAGSWASASDATHPPGNWKKFTPSGGDATVRYWRFHKAGTGIHVRLDLRSWEIVGEAISEIDASLAFAEYRVDSCSIDKSRRMTAGQADIEIPLELAADVVLATDGVFKTNAPIRIYQWYGDPADEVRVFTGSVDELREGRDPRHLKVVARDMMKRLIEQTITLIAPQGEDEDDNDRTTANYVYLNTDVDEILDDLLDKAGVPEADRDIDATSYAIDEFLGSDGASFADTIIGDDRLTGLIGYDLWADELGIYKWKPVVGSVAADSDSDPAPVYSYEIGHNPTTWAAATTYATGDRVVPTALNDHYYEATDDGASHATTEPTWPTNGSTVVDNGVTWQDMGALNLITSALVTQLDHSIDEYELRTRVKVRGNLAIAVPAWTQAWSSAVLTLPVGVMWVPATPTYIYVLDKGTKKIYRLLEATGAKAGGGIWPLSVAADVDYPIGLSRDPADADRFWVLDAQYWETGLTTGSKIHKYDLSDGSHLAEYNIADGQWTDIKVSSANIWLSSWSTDKVHKHSKVDGSAVASYTMTYGGVAQVNPTGIAIDGTTLAIFFYGKARFLLVDESDPTTIDTTNALGVTSAKISTAGTKILGGEINTDSHAVLYAVHDGVHRTWKFNLTTPSTDEVSAEAVDTELEDELGFLMSAEDREHDSHPGDADHPYEIRRETMDIQKILSNLAQATETAAARLELLAHRRETLDVGTVGNPALQRSDPIKVTDFVTGVDTLYLADTLRSNMDARGFFMTLALLPYEATY